MVLENKRILIFEDNVENVFVQKKLLTDEGAHVKLFLGGTLQVILKLLPLDLIIMDLMIPGDMDGFDFFQKLQTVPELSAIPVAAVSAMDASLAINKTREMGFAGFIPKPVDMDAFPIQIAAIIDGHPIWNAR